MYEGAVGGCIGRPDLSDETEQKYMDRLLDVDYMTGVLQKTDAIIEEKRDQIQNWEKTKRRILIVLVLQVEVPLILLISL